MGRGKGGDGGRGGMGEREKRERERGDNKKEEVERGGKSCGGGVVDHGRILKDEV